MLFVKFPFSEFLKLFIFLNQNKNIQSCILIPWPVVYSRSTSWSRRLTLKGRFYLFLLAATVDTLPPSPKGTFISHRMAFSDATGRLPPQVPAKFASSRLHSAYTLWLTVASMPPNKHCCHITPSKSHARFQLPFPQPKYSCRLPGISVYLEPLWYSCGVHNK